MLHITFSCYIGDETGFCKTYAIARLIKRINKSLAPPYVFAHKCT